MLILLQACAGGKLEQNPLHFVWHCWMTSCVRLETERNGQNTAFEYKGGAQGWVSRRAGHETINAKYGDVASLTA